jgi:hypothetical protein
MQLFCGGTLRLMADRGASVMLRVTDDRYDSVGMSVAGDRCEHHAMRRAADILIDEIIELGWKPTAWAMRANLRCAAVHLSRPTRASYAVMSFDPYGAFHEDNQDHIKVAHAVDETYWTAQFDKHHPEHFDEGLAPRRLTLFSRVGSSVTPVDIVDHRP